MKIAIISGILVAILFVLLRLATLKQRNFDELEDKIDKLEKDLKERNIVLGSIYQKAREYEQKNLSIAYVGLKKIEDLSTTFVK